MTLREFLGLMLRRWYVIVAALCAAAVLTILFARDGGIYSNKTIVTFTLPATSLLMAQNGNTNDSVIAFAGAVATQVNRGRPATRFYSRSDAPFYGAGIRQGVTVALRNDGTQWTTSYGSAIIEVEIVGRTHEWVERQQTDILAAIESIARTEQARADVDGDHQIAVHVEPLTKAIEHIVPSRSAQLGAAGAMTGAALLVGGWVALTLDRRARARLPRTGTSPHATREYAT